MPDDQEKLADTIDRRKAIARAFDAMEMEGAGIPNPAALPMARRKMEELRERYGAMFRAAEAAAGLEPDTMLRLAAIENRGLGMMGELDALSPKGAAGIMQLTPITAKEMQLDPDDRYDPEKAIPAAAQYFKKLKKDLGDHDLAVMAYNRGPANVVQYGRDTYREKQKRALPLETREYMVTERQLRQAAEPQSAYKGVLTQTAEEAQRRLHKMTD